MARTSLTFKLLRTLTFELFTADATNCLHKVPMEYIVVDGIRWEIELYLWQIIEYEVRIPNGNNAPIQVLSQYYQNYNQLQPRITTEELLVWWEDISRHDNIRSSLTNRVHTRSINGCLTRVMLHCLHNARHII